MTPPAPNALQEDLTLLLPPAPPAAASSQAWLWAGVAVIVLLGAAIIAWRISQRRRRATAPTDSPEVVALRELARWRALPGEAALRDAVAAVSGTLRRYVENRFGLRAPTLTTEEFWMAQENRRAVPAPHDRFWTSFFQATDTVKYAGHWPTQDQFAALLEMAEGYVKNAASAAVPEPVVPAS